MDAAQAVCGSAEGQAAALSLLSGLVKKSMVVAERSSGESTRYSLLESHHDFADERLRESEELDLMRRRHHDYSPPWSAQDSTRGPLPGPRSRRLSGDQATAVGDQRRLHPVHRADLAEHRGHVALDRRLGQVQRAADLRVGQALPDQRDDLTPPVGQ